jgi:hypothetical protein
MRRRFLRSRADHKVGVCHVGFRAKGGIWCGALLLFRHCAHSAWPSLSMTPRGSADDRRNGLARPLGSGKHALAARCRVQRRSVPIPQRPRGQEHGYRASLRAWPGSRQQKRAKRQNSKKISRLKPKLPSRTATAQLSVNLDCGPWVRLSLMTLWRVALETVDEPGFGRPEGEPVAPGLLQCNEELPTALHRFRVEVVPALELGLESKLAA